jgi:hypothetical protein
MPTIAPNQIYSFFALVTISSILLTSFAAYATTLRYLPENEQLNNLMKQITNIGYELITLTETTNATSKVTLQLPTRIGTRGYWVRLANDSQQTWIEGALSSELQGNLTNRVYIIPFVEATGSHTSENGVAFLECYLNNYTAILHLGTWGES